jgi:hypothetical protein
MAGRRDVPEGVLLTEQNPYSELTLTQRRYVDARLQGVAPVAAKELIGTTSNLESHPKIRAAIRWVIKESTQSVEELTKSDVMQGMLDAVDAAETSQELVGAWRELGKLIGAYEPERKVLEIHDYTKDELKALTDEQLAQLAGKGMREVVDGEFTELIKAASDEGSS